MSMFTLKIIAIISMFMDHIGYQYGINAFRIIGRLAFPIFAFLVVNGFFKTRNKWKYLARMLVFAVLSEIPFDLCFRNVLFAWSYQNVFFTLAIGLLCLIITDMILKMEKLKYLCFIIPVASMITAEYIRSDYGWSGVLMIVAFYLCYDKKQDKIRILPAMLSVAAITLCPLIYEFVCDITENGVKVTRAYFEVFVKNNSWQFTQLYRLFAVLLIDGYNGSRGYEFRNRLSAAAVKYGFYIFYPLHLILLYLWAEML